MAFSIANLLSNIFRNYPQDKIVYVRDLKERVLPDLEALAKYQNDQTPTGVTAGTYGTATKVARVTISTTGKVTAASEVTISGVPPGGAAGGDLQGSYPNPTVVPKYARHFLLMGS